MTTRNVYVGYNYGADLSPDQATEGSSTGSTNVELRITYDDAAYVPSRTDILLIAEAIKRYLEDGRTAVLPL